MFETTTTPLPAHWACALINGDDSSFDLHDDDAAARERVAVEETVARLFEEGGWYVVDVTPDEPYFSSSFHHYHPDPGEGVTCGDLMEYVLHRTTRAHSTAGQ